MAETRAYLRLLALNREDVGEILTRANRVLAEDIGYERFITMLLVSLDPKARMLTYANAGHPPGFVFNGRGEIKMQLKRSGIPLGLKPDTRYPPGTGVKLERGDTVLILTDGIDEAMSPDNTIFGIERALEIVRTHRDKPARELVETLYAGVRQFSQNAPQQDDVTAVVIKAV
jgi:sigma-B regulation protein RsbU (phosphoserine phosphatase)